MLARLRNSKRKGFLAAPIVMTAMLTPGCEDRVYTNPQRPQSPDPSSMTVATAAIPSMSVAPTAQPVATAAPTSTATAEPVEPAPTGGGTVVKQKDGTCLFVFDEPKMECPPATYCNPGPPRDPIHVKCSDKTR